MVKKRLFAAACILISAVILFVVLRPGEERRIRRSFRSLSDLVSRSSNESPIVTAAKLAKMEDLFAETCEMVTSVEGLSGTYQRRELVQTALMVSSQFRSVRLTFHDISVRIISPADAEVAATARLQGTSTAGERVEEVREVLCRMERADGRWLFTECRTVDILKK